MDDKDELAPRVDQLLRVCDVAQIFAVKSYTVRSWIKDGRLNAIKLPTGHFRIYTSEVRRFANNKYGEINV